VVAFWSLQGAGEGRVERLHDPGARRLCGNLGDGGAGVDGQWCERGEVDWVGDVDDDLAGQLVAVGADDGVDGGVGDGEHNDVADQRVADRAGAYVAGQVPAELLSLAGFVAEQGDGVSTGQGAGGDAARHVAGADDGDLQDGPFVRFMCVWSGACGGGRDQ